MPLSREPMQHANIFFSYAQQDQKLREDLENQLSVSKMRGLITTRDHRNVVPGDDWESGLNSLLNTAQIVLLLISPDYFTSERCLLEMQQALKRRQTEKAHVIPILLRPVDDWENAPFGKLQALPADGKPVSRWENRDKALADVAKGIRNAIEQLNLAYDSYSAHHSIRGLPPPTDSISIQQREHIVKEVYARLTQKHTTAIALTGLAGVGKSILAALVYKYAETQREADKGPFTAEPLWLDIDPTNTLTDIAQTVFEVMERPLPNFSDLTPQSQALEFFHALSATDEPRLIVLNQFENLLDWQTGYALSDRPGIGEWLDAINSQKCICRVLLTGRPFPQGTRKFPPTHLQEFHVEGLEESESIQLLQKLGVRGTEIELRTVVGRCDGHAFALTLLATLLDNHKLSLAHLLAEPEYEHLWTGNIARNILDSIFKQQLDQVQRKLLLGFSVYREWVPLSAARTVMSDARIEYTRLYSACEALLTQHLLRADEGCYQSHAIVISYAREHFVEGDEQANRKALRKAHAKAARYYRQRTCPPRELRRRSSDVHDLIEAAWHLCRAEKWQEAFALVQQEGLFSDLQRWGESTTLLELYQLLLPSAKWRPERTQEACIYNELGEVYNRLGQKEEARKYFEKALDIYQETGERRGEVNALNNLGQVCRVLGEKTRALDYYQKALRISEEIEDIEGKSMTLSDLGSLYADLGQQQEAINYYKQALALPTHKSPGEDARTLNNLGKVYQELGQKEEAYKYYQQALNLFREIGDHWGQAVTLNNLALHYRKLGNTQGAQEYYKQALKLFRETADRWSEGITLRNLGQLYLVQGHYDVSLACFLLARRIFEAIQNPAHGRIPKYVIALMRKQAGEQEFAAMQAEVESQALQIVEQALLE